MADPQPSRHHSIDYIEFVVDDIARAKAFYGDSFGWAFTDYGPGYCGIREDGREVGGLCVGEPRPGGPLVVLFSAQLEATCAAVVAAGGTITKPTFEFPGGHRFHFRDPAGNELAVWSTAAQQG